VQTISQVLTTPPKNKWQSAGFLGALYKKVQPRRNSNERWVRKATAKDKEVALPKYRFRVQGETSSPPSNESIAYTSAWMPSGNREARQG